jgi:hypothetical protein
MDCGEFLIKCEVGEANLVVKFITPIPQCMLETKVGWCLAFIVKKIAMNLTLVAFRPHS